MSNESEDKLFDQLGEFVIGKLRELRALNTELNLINNNTTSIVSVLDAVNQQVIELIELNSTEDNASILSKVELVHKKLIELAELLIEGDIDVQNEVDVVLRIEEQYLKLVELAKSNLAESNKTNVIFAIKVIYGNIIESTYPYIQGNCQSNFPYIIETINQVLIESTYPYIQDNCESNFPYIIETINQRLIELMELNLIEKSSRVFIPVIRQKYNHFFSRTAILSSPHAAPTIQTLYQEIFSFTPTRKTLYEDIIITDKNIKNDSHSLVKGIFLYTDGDSEIVDYMMSNFEDFDKLTGEWCYIYVLEKKGINWKLLIKYWKYLLLSELHEIFKPIKLFTKKPFNRNESYKIARDLGIPSDQLPCIVFLPPLTEISGQEKLIIPVKEASTKYFRKVFSNLESIGNKAKEQNKYEAIKAKFNFDDIIQYLENNSEKVVQQTTIEYQYNGTNISVFSSNIASLTGTGTIDTAIKNQE
ncbi:hypothetical protein [Dapis sp. BLCC M172]|uniref:hypothetical protein n=1 Tax=Dapis sp. BLCC M172 TaxID=2975281 RepID=UPI003CEA94BC